MNKKLRIQDQLIEISVTDKIYNGPDNVWFKKRVVKISELPEILKTHNYSLIQWMGGSRKATNFIKAAGFVGDIDEGLEIQQAHERLKKLNLNHIIIPSKSHTAEHHKFHFLLPFNKYVYSAETYKQIASLISSDIISECDSSVTDAARFIYGSPDEADVIEYWGGDNFNVVEFDGLWNDSLEVIDSKGEKHSILDIKEKTKIFCPFHEDERASAFLDHSQESQNWFIYCSACDETYWKEKSKSYLQEICNPFWSYGTDVFQIGILNEDLYIEKIGAKKFHILTNTEEVDEKTRAFRYLVNSKHIAHLSRIDFLSDIEAEKSFHQVKNEDGIIEVHYAPIQENIQDNKYIENYLDDRFGQHKKFIKEYLSVFCYTNYQKLPTLIFTGERGTGKSTFPEVIGEIFPPLTMEWRGDENRFTPEAEKKLLVVEENSSDRISQYKTLKKYSGQKYATVEKKFKDPYRVMNNMNMILLSNEVIALYVSRDELPTDSRNNQFFVLEFPPLTDSINPNIQDELLDRMGHYVRTELKNVFNGLNMSGYRYSIDVPITDAEKELFESNATDIELDTDQYLAKFIEYYGPDAKDNPGPYVKFVSDGYIPADFFKDFNLTSQSYHRIIKNLRKRKLIKGKPERPSYDKKRLYSFCMTDKMKNLIDDAKGKQVGKKRLQ